MPVAASEAAGLGACLDAIAEQRYGLGRIEVLVVGYGSGGPPTPGAFGAHPIRVFSVASSTPYAARNAGAAEAEGDLFLFTEVGCLADPDWVSGHVAALADAKASVSVGHVVPARTTFLVDVFASYENRRDEWVFSGTSWQHYFGRPKNMAVLRRRFESHGPFVEVPRGSDSKLVQKVARELSCDEVVLATRAVVRQRSIRGLPSCFKDRFGHSYALETNRSSHAARIALGDRARLLRDTVRREGYGPFRALLLLGLLATGVLVFRVGGIVGRARRAKSAVSPATQR